MSKGLLIFLVLQRSLFLNQFKVEKQLGKIAQLIFNQLAVRKFSVNGFFYGFVRKTMNIIKFGSESEYVKFEIPSSFSTEGRAQILVEIRVNCFSGTINPWIDSADIELFTISLRKLYETLKGEAKFVPLEKQLTLKFESKTGGKISVIGIAWSQASYENKLEFHLELDQTYLQLPLKILEVLCREIKANS